MSYDHRRIEAGWQRRWDSMDLFAARRQPGQPKFYCYNPAPYLTGSLHMGHVRNYTYGDFLARVMRLRGANVLYTIGFDALGLPTEMAAIRNRCHPAEWTSRCRGAMEQQLRALGFGFDWRRSFMTSDVGYYRWTQWIFLALLEQGLVYSTEATVGWCPRCETSLARSQVIEGCCWLCDGAVEERRSREWRLRISRYLDELLEGLHEIRDLNGLADEGQRTLIGRKPGVAVNLEIPATGARLQAYLRDPGDWFRDCIVVVDGRDETTLAAVNGAVTAVEISTGRRFPIAVASNRDPLFSEQPLLAPRSDPDGDPPSGEWDPAALVPMTVFRQKDFSISRERLWGTPIPVVLCPACGEVPLRDEDLPLVAPDIVFDEASGTLKRADPDGGQRDCPSCGRPARLDPLVMDCHMDSLWHYFRPCSGESTDFLFDPAEVAYWMPVDCIQFGRDVIPFMLDLRFFTRFLHDRGRVPFAEFCTEAMAHGLVLCGGRKMSKHLGNVVDPVEVAERYGADSLRFYMLAHASPRSDFDWSEGGIRRYFDLLSSFHAMIHAMTAAPSPGKVPGQGDAPPQPGLRSHTRVFFGKVARQLVVLDRGASDGHFDRYAAALDHLLQAMLFFWSHHFTQERDPSFADTWQATVRRALLYLAPVAPHLAEECWMRLGEKPSIFQHGHFPAPETIQREELVSSEVT